jgi:hypothetical protein
MAAAEDQPTEGRLLGLPASVQAYGPHAMCIRIDMLYDTMNRRDLHQRTVASSKHECLKAHSDCAPRRASTRAV